MVRERVRGIKIIGFFFLNLTTSLLLALNGVPSTFPCKISSKFEFQCCVPRGEYSEIQRLVLSACCRTPFSCLNEGDWFPVSTYLSRETLSSAEASLCRTEAGKREKRKRAGEDGKGKQTRALAIFRLLLFSLVYIPSISFCGGESMRNASLGK